MQRLDLTVFKALISPCVDYQICFSRILQQDPIFCCRKEGSSTEKCNQRPVTIAEKASGQGLLQILKNRKKICNISATSAINNEIKYKKPGLMAWLF